MFRICGTRTRVKATSVRGARRRRRRLQSLYLYTYYLYIIFTVWTERVRESVYVCERESDKEGVRGLGPLYSGGRGFNSIESPKVR